MITKATADGTLYTRDWDTEPLFPLPNVDAVNKEYSLFLSLSLVSWLAFHFVCIYIDCRLHMYPLGLEPTNSPDPSTYSCLCLVLNFSRIDAHKKNPGPMDLLF